ncbi:MAG: HAMP domain-containing histidine kinase [Verrucomicrobiota bacterium]|nr:HAMP domain-containing histidine kinase [Verrucomicrobiota bacterium]
MSETNSSDLRVPMADVARFVRQLSHDLRNQLNAAELQSAYLKEIASDAEIKDEVQRLRGMLGEMSTALQRLTGSLATPKLTEMSYESKALLEDFEAKVRTEFPENSAEIEWDVNVGESVVSIDPQLFLQSLLHLVGNAFQHARGSGPIKISANANGELRIAVTEPKTGFAESTAAWGREPFRNLKHGHYGLGLHRVRNIIEAHRGQIEARNDSASSSLVTIIVLPLVEQN